MADIDMVNAPPHYNQHLSGVQPAWINEHWSCNFGAAFKYVWRAGLKSDDPLQDSSDPVDSPCVSR
jgi:hypothetical protein